MSIDQFTDLLTAAGTVAWPIIAVVVICILFPSIKALLNRGKVTIKIGGMEISAEEATKSLSSQIEDLQNKIVEIERKLTRDPESLALEHLGLTKPIRRGEKLRILWVDDFPSNNAIQIEKLMNDGYWIDVASLTAQAIEMFENTKYDLVISDMGRIEEGANKPDAGIILTRELRTRDKNVPIIIFSTKTAIQRYGDQAHEAGAKYATNSTIDLYKIISIELGKTNNAN